MANDIVGKPLSPQEQALNQAKHENTRLEAPGTYDDGWKYSPDYHEFSDFLGLKSEDKMDFDVAKKVSFLRDFTETDDITEAKSKLKDHIRKLGLPMRGRELLDNLYKYSRLYSDRIRLDKELGLYKNGEEKQQIKKPSLKIYQQNKVLKSELEKVSHEKRVLKRQFNQISRILGR